MKACKAILSKSQILQGIMKKSEVNQGEISLIEIESLHKFLLMSLKF